jgi:hypothetical protein
LRVAGAEPAPEYHVIIFCAVRTIPVIADPGHGSSGLIPARAIGAPVAEPHLYRVIMRPLLQHHVRSRDGVEQRGKLDFLAGSGAILCVKKTETVEHGFDPCG